MYNGKKSEENKGSDKEALYAYSEAVSTVSILRKVPLGYRLDSAYLMDKIELFENAIKLAYSVGKGGRCCEFIEQVKSRILTATLSIPRVPESSPGRGGVLTERSFCPSKKEI